MSKRINRNFHLKASQILHAQFLPDQSVPNRFNGKPYMIGISGERGIRTPGTPKGTTDFESAPIDHSGSSPINSFTILK